jgi:hypothetical protein
MEDRNEILTSLTWFAVVNRLSKLLRSATSGLALALLEMTRWYYCTDRKVRFSKFAVILRCLAI